MKKLISIFLAAAMCLSLAACGGTKQEEVKEETPEFVYAAEYTPLSSDSDRYINPQVYTDDGMYMSIYEKVGENIPEGVTPSYEGEYDVYENRIYFVGYDGSMKRLEGYEAMEAENDESKAEFYSGSGINGLFMDKDGNLLSLEYLYSNWFDGPEGMTQYDEDYWMYMQYKEDYYLRKLNPDGSEISRTIIEVPEDQYLNTYGAAIDADGNLVVGMEMGIAAIKPDGGFAYRIEHDEYVDRTLLLADGRLAALSWGETGMELLPVENGAFGEPLVLPYDAYNLFQGGGEYDFYYTSGISFYGYDVESKTATKLFSWIDCDVNSNELGKIHITSDGRIIGVLNNWDNDSETYTSELITVSKVPYESVPHKETITFACVYLDYQVQSQIIDFNRHNDKYRIEVKDYSEYNTEEDYNAGATKLSTEIMAGNVPDIISLGNSGISYNQLAAKGILEDLYPYIDADSEFSREDFFPNVLASLEVEGKLFSTVSGFYITSLSGASSVVGDTPGWTYDEFDAALASMPEGCDPMEPYVTRDTILNTCLALDMPSYVNWSTGECRFDSQDFIDLLEFANRFPAEYNWEENQMMESTQDRIQQGKQMLMDSYIFSVSEMMYNDSYFGGDMTYIGYPTNNGTGSVLNMDNGFAMSSNCKNKEAAWSFLRAFFTEEGQKKLYNLPSNINVYNAQVEKAMTPEYQRDADGNFLLNESGDKIPIIQMTYMNPDGTVTEVYNMTQEQADRLWDLVTTTTKRADYNTDIFEIVLEQAAAFFEGQKSAEEVARLIQSKANIFVNEQR